MKKLLVVLSVLFVVALIAGSAFAVNMYDPEQRANKLAAEKAAPLKVYGEYTFGMISNFTAEEGNIGYANNYANFALYPDEYNTILFRLAGVAKTGPWTDPVVTMPYFNITTDFGMILDLPVNLKSTLGKTDLYTRKYEVTGLGYERFYRPAMDPIPWKVEVGTDMFTVWAGMSFGGDGSPVAATAEAARDIGALVAIPAIGPASAEIFYLAPNDADYKGDLGFNVKAVDLLNGMLSVAAGFSYNLRDSAETIVALDYQELWQYGIGALVKYSKFKVGASINGNDLDALNQIGIDGAIALTDIFGIDAAVGLSVADGADTFQGAEFSAYAKVGMAKWSVGYQIKDNTAFNYVPAVANANGGLFIAVDGDF